MYIYIYIWVNMRFVKILGLSGYCLQTTSVWMPQGLRVSCVDRRVWNIWKPINLIKLFWQGILNSAEKYSNFLLDLEQKSVKGTHRIFCIGLTGSLLYEDPWEKFTGSPLKNLPKEATGSLYKICTRTVLRNSQDLCCPAIFQRKSHGLCTRTV